MFSYRDFRVRASSRAVRNEATLDRRIYSCEFASIRGLNTSPPPRTSFVVEPFFLFVGASDQRLRRKSGTNVNTATSNSRAGETRQSMLKACDPRQNLPTRQNEYSLNQYKSASAAFGVSKCCFHHLQKR